MYVCTDVKLGNNWTHCYQIVHVYSLKLVKFYLLFIRYSTLYITNTFCFDSQKSTIKVYIYCYTFAIGKRKKKL